jgi:hypothetical protein
MTATARTSRNEGAMNAPGGGQRTARVGAQEAQPHHHLRPSGLRQRLRPRIVAVPMSACQIVSGSR